MDSQTNALYDNQTFSKPVLSELSFNSTNGQHKPKAPKHGSSVSSSQAASPTGRKLVIMPAGSIDHRKVLESASPFLSPSSSFVKSRQHHSMKSLKLGEQIQRSFKSF